MLNGYSVDSVLLPVSAFPLFSSKNGLIVISQQVNGKLLDYLPVSKMIQNSSVEIQERLADMAERLSQIKWLGRADAVICDDFLAISRGARSIWFCANPPYFKVDANSNLNEREHHLLARHEITTYLKKLSWSAQSILIPAGVQLSSPR